MGISINGPSGIDTQYIIDSLVSLEQTKVTNVASQKKAYQVKIDAYSKFKTLINDLKSSASALSLASSFDLFKPASSDENKVTLSGGTGSVDAQYDVRVFQLSGNEKMISGDNLIQDQTTSLSSISGMTLGDFSIDGVAITVDADDTIQDLREKINSAVDENGKKLGVTASVLEVADNNYRLVLSAKESGSEGVNYQDVGTANVLQTLGIIQNAEGDKGITNQTLTANGAISGFEALGVGETVTISGINHFGETVQHTFVKKADATVENFLDEISQTFNGLVNVAVDNPESPTSITIENKIGGSSQLAIESITFNAATPTSATITTTQYGDEGDGVLSKGKDTWFSVENMTMSSSSNKAENIINGVSFEFKGVTRKEDASVNVSLTRDLDGIKNKFQGMIDAYNALVRFKKDATKLANPDDEDSTSGDLAGDSTVSTIISQIRSSFRQNFDFENTAYTNFTMVGLKTDTQTGEFRIDDEMFKKAIDTDLENVIKMFTTNGLSDNRAVTLGRSTIDTTAGNYIIEEVDAEHFRIRLEDSEEWFTSETRVSDIMTFADGPAKGLSINAPAGSLGVGNTAQFSLIKGLASVLDESINKLDDSRDGLIAMRQESLRKSINYADDKIANLEDRIERYRLRLVKQFSAMEQAMSQMQSQSANMINSLSYTSKD
ncbi:MAG: flagellar filament capping protein FliD [Chitinispirillaceae bacterium]|nr:flagellar filament capping protein FliD [Chitinispirillaceae bacterium]